jgi:CRP-like cAMP-binding protein
VHAGQFVGELSFFDGKPRSATGEAATDLKVLKLDQAKLDREIKKLPSWLLVLIRSIADRMRSADELVKRNRIVDQQMTDEFQRWEGGTGPTPGGA